jgi:hypothetical protein
VLDYGYRSRCCYAPIRLGRKKIKKTSVVKEIWICTRCGGRDVSLIEYNTNTPSGSTPIIGARSNFLLDDDFDFRDKD